MALFKRKGGRSHTVDELIVLRSYGKAEALVRSQLKGSKDPHLRMKLGDVLAHQGRADEAVEEYLAASDDLLLNGFVDRARAVLVRARKMGPARQDVELRLQRMEERKRMEMLRGEAVAALRAASQSQEGARCVALIELEQIWDRLSATELIKRLPRTQLSAILRNVSVERFAQKKRLVAEGSDHSMAFIICNGDVEARRLSSAGSVSLRTFGLGDLLGERSLLGRELWPVTLVTLEPVTALVLQRDGFEAALTGNSDPRGLIEALRTQRHDDEVQRLVRQLQS